MLGERRSAPPSSLQQDTAIIAQYHDRGGEVQIAPLMNYALRCRPYAIPDGVDQHERFVLTRV